MSENTHIPGAAPEGRTLKTPEQSSCAPSGALAATDMAETVQTTVQPAGTEASLPHGAPASQPAPTAVLNFETPRAFVERMRVAVREVRTTKSLAGTGLFSAVALVLNQFTIMVSQMLEIGFSFLGLASAAFLYGPWLGAMAGVVVDLLGYFLRPNGGFFPGYTLNEMLAGFLYGAWLYRRPVKLARVFCACLSVVLLINFCLTPLWLHLQYGNAFALSTMRIVKNAIKLPVDTLLLYAVCKALEKYKKPASL